VRYQRKEAIKTLVKLGARINVRESEGDTPLMTAVSELKTTDIAGLLLDLGAKIDMQRDGATALDIAAFWGDKNHVELLLRRGAQPNVGSGECRSSPIANCAHDGNVEMLKILIAAGADVNAPKYGWLPISSAALRRHKKFVHLLIESKANVNLRKDHKDFTPLMCAVRGGDLEIVRMLLSAGAKINDVVFEGHPISALDIAEQNKKSAAIIAFLRSQGAKHSVELPESVTTPPPQNEADEFWQLDDDSVLTVTLDPWPPRAGESKLKAEITSPGHDPKLSFSGTVEYRIATTEENSKSWLPMKRIRKDRSNSVHFSETVTLTTGTVFIQFRVRAEWHEDFICLNDWSVSIR
jgi:hypothetical protein